MPLVRCTAAAAVSICERRHARDKVLGLLVCRASSLQAWLSAPAVSSACRHFRNATVKFRASSPFEVLSGSVTAQSSFSNVHILSLAQAASAVSVALQCPHPGCLTMICFIRHSNGTMALLFFVRLMAHMEPRESSGTVPALLTLMSSMSCVLRSAPLHSSEVLT